MGAGDGTSRGIGHSAMGARKLALGMQEMDHA
jgi:hypothetical protein